MFTYSLVTSLVWAKEKVFCIYHYFFYFSFFSHTKFFLRQGFHFILPDLQDNAILSRQVLSYQPHNTLKKRKTLKCRLLGSNPALWAAIHYNMASQASQPHMQKVAHAFFISSNSFICEPLTQ